MYEEFDEYDLKQKIDFRLWAKTFKTLRPYWKYWVAALVAIAIIALQKQCLCINLPVVLKVLLKRTL